MVRLGPVETQGTPFSVHSDLPMAPSNPLFLAWCAIKKKSADGKVFRPDLSVSRHAALQAITINAAQSWRMENRIGSIKTGKDATFTIIEKNPYNINAEEI